MTLRDIYQLVQVRPDVRFYLRGGKTVIVRNEQLWWELEDRRAFLSIEELVSDEWAVLCEHSSPQVVVEDEVVWFRCAGCGENMAPVRFQVSKSRITLPVYSKIKNY